MSRATRRAAAAVARATRTILRRDYTLGAECWPDIAPHIDCGIMRRPNGDIWIPTAVPESALFRHPTRTDWQRHAMAATAQVRALARAVTLAEHNAALPNQTDQPEASSAP